MARILVQISLLDREWPIIRSRLLQSMQNLRNNDGHEVKFLVVYQADVRISMSELSVPELLSDDIEVLLSPIKSVSCARNFGIEHALKFGFDAILFHDATLLYEAGFLSVYDAVEVFPQGEMAMADVVWSDHPKSSARVVRRGRTRIGLFSHAYVWAYLFKLGLIGSLRFDESVGPGERTRFPCGEDVLFMNAYALKNNVRHVCVTGQKVYHPPRPGDLSKHLLYAEGQGALYRHFLSHCFHARPDLAFSTLKELLMFFLNGVLLAALRGEKGRSIFRKRWAGFVKGFR